jgi:single-strand DNA-binding protein
MVNKVILVGRLTADPEVRSAPSGTLVANLRLATNSYVGTDKDGAVREQAEFHTLVLFGRQAEIAAGHLCKGRLLYAEGRSQTRSWETAEGQKRTTTEVVVDRWSMLGPRPPGAPAPAGAAAAAGTGLGLGLGLGPSE